jgi:hypothetical protein
MNIHGANFDIWFNVRKVEEFFLIDYIDLIANVKAHGFWQLVY